MYVFMCMTLYALKGGTLSSLISSYREEGKLFTEQQLKRLLRHVAKVYTDLPYMIYNTIYLFLILRDFVIFILWDWYI